MTDVTPLTVMVTGATSGIGAATARRFAADGARLVLAARRTERLRALADELSVPAHVVTLDVGDRAAVDRAVSGLPEAFAAIDVLINNAGVALGLKPAHEAQLDDWEEMIDTNVKGLVFVARAVLPGMVARRRGHVVNIGSVAGTYPYPGGNVYGGTKAFVHQFSLNLRADLLGTGVRVTCVEPGMTDTEFSQVRFKGDREKAKQVYAGAEAMRGEDVAEVIHAVCALPAHVNVNIVEVMPVRQAFAPYAIYREGG
jgi:3-hydroxy acid dehydrogenase/malonic semialdehyde reductase